MGPDLGQLLGLGAQRPGGALHFGGVVDRVLAVLVGPARLEAPPRLVECRIGLRGGAPRAVKSRGQSRNLKRATDLQCLVDRPGVPPCRGDQRSFAYVLKLHTTSASDSRAISHPSKLEISLLAQCCRSIHRIGAE